MSVWRAHIHMIACVGLSCLSPDVFDGTWERPAHYSRGLDFQQQHLPQRFQCGKNREAWFLLLSVQMRSLSVLLSGGEAPLNQLEPFSKCDEHAVASIEYKLWFDRFELWWKLVGVELKTKLGLQVVLAAVMELMTHKDMRTVSMKKTRVPL